MSMPPATKQSYVSMAKMMRVDSHAQVETEASLRVELEAARKALRLQTTRSRLVDAALSRKLEQRECELRSWQSLRDEQLSHVMRALMVLEARLRREQRSIRCLLGERDAVIRAQQLEIARLRKLLDSETRQEEVKSITLGDVTTIPSEFDYDCNVKPDLISSLGIAHSRRSQEKSQTSSSPDNEDAQSNLDSLQLSFYEIGSQPESLSSNLSTQSCQGDSHDSMDPTKDFTDFSADPSSKSPLDVCCSRMNSSRTVNNFNDLKSSYVQEQGDINKVEHRNHSGFYPYQKNILSPVKEESSIILSASSSPVRCNPCEEQSTQESCVTLDCKPSPSTLLQEVRISGRNEYEDNPVLNCVNQILLRDQEEFLEEQRAIRLKEQEKAKREAEALNNKKLTKSTENLSLLNEHLIVQQQNLIKSKAYSPLSKGTLQISSEQVVSCPSIQDESDKHYTDIQDIGKPLSPNKLTPTKDNTKSKSSPPALPPKPLRLVQSRQKPLDQKTILNSILPQDVNAIEIIKNHVPLPQPSTDNELYVISNSAIDDELLQHLQGRRVKSCPEVNVSLNQTKPLSKSRENIYSPLMSHPTHKPPPKPTSTSPQKDKPKSLKVTPKKSPTSKEEDIPKTTPKHSPIKKVISPTSCIKVASPVSSLINSVDAIESDIDQSNERKTSPSVSQMVRKFEVLGTKLPTEPETQQPADNSSDSLQKNFEEFRLDECDMDNLCNDGRPEGDGAEVRLTAETRISYENFLEATGLSQKSIMTPSRLFSNHKSVMKPKDVKHRSRVKAAAGLDRCISHAPGPVVRYWTEPFL